MTASDATNDIDQLSAWIGRTESMTDTITAPWARLMEQTLDRPASLGHGDPLPPLWHWIYFIQAAPLGGLGRDGHPKRGGFLPPVALPRRMWAGGRLRFEAPLLIGETVIKTSTIRDVVMKSGSSGDLCFVTVVHDFSVDGAPRLTEEQDLVYRNDPAPGSQGRRPDPAPAEAEWRQTVTPSTVQLFRYSALTFNGHRIHYDREYAADVEGYAGLVFHGPLTATLLADAAATETGQRLTSFSFRARAPLFDTDPFVIGGTRRAGGATVWAETPEGGLAMTAEADTEDW